MIRLCSRLRAFLEPILCSFAYSGCADDDFCEQLCSNDEQYFFSRVWEAILFERFSNLGWGILKLKKGGPDFQVKTQSCEVYVEATVPAPEGLPAEWLSADNGVKSMPYEGMLLRWTSSLTTKSKKHLEDINKLHVEAHNPFVIAINSCRLSRFSDDYGISQWPFAVESVFPIGPIAIRINKNTGKAGKAYQSERFKVYKSKTAVDIPTDNFLNPEYKHVSALLGCAACYAEEETRKKFHGLPPMFLVHNPLAERPLPEGWLPGAIEYKASKTAKDEFTLSRLDKAN